MKDYQTVQEKQRQKVLLQFIKNRYHKTGVKLPLRMDNTPVQRTGRPYNGSPPPKLESEGRGKETRLEKENDIHVHLMYVGSTQDPFCLRKERKLSF